MIPYSMLDGTTDGSSQDAVHLTTHVLTLVVLPYLAHTPQFVQVVHICVLVSQNIYTLKGYES